MAKGGKRVGAGRKPGAVTVRTREVAAKAIAAGDLDPLTVMLENMRHFHQLAADAEATLQGISARELLAQPADAEAMSEKDQFEILLAHVRKAADLRDRSQSCARDAARFMHAPIAAVDTRAKADDSVPLPERLKAYTREDAIAASGTKVVELKRSKP